MRKYITMLLLAMTTMTAIADINKTIQQYRPQFAKMVEGVKNMDEVRLIADSLIRLNSKDPFNNLFSVFTYVIQSQDSLTSIKGVAAADAALKNLPTKFKDIRTICLHIKGLLTAENDSREALNLLKQAWSVEPWSQSFYDMALLSLELGDTITLKKIIDTVPADVEPGYKKAAKIMLSSFNQEPAATYNDVIKFVETYPIEAGLQVAFDIVKRGIPNRLPKLVAFLSANYTPLPEFETCYREHREEVEAELDRLYETTPDDEKWGIEAGRVGLHNLLGEYHESWNILKRMEAEGLGDPLFLQEQLIDAAISQTYNYEIIEYTDKIPEQDMDPEVACARLKALLNTDRKQDIINLANVIMRKDPDLAFLAYYAIGIAESNDKQWEKALDAFNTSEIYNEKEGCVLLNQAAILNKLGQTQKADALYKRLTAWDEDKMVITTNDNIKALAMVYSGDKEGALTIAEKQLQKSDLKWFDYYLPVYVYYYLGEKDKGADLLRKANALYPHAIENLTFGYEWETFRADIANINP